MEFAIKNMEYKAIDDSTVKKSNEGQDAASSSSDANTIAEDEDVRGFLFGRLIERIPEKREELMSVRDQLLSQENVEETLKVAIFLDQDMLPEEPIHSFFFLKKIA